MWLISRPPREGAREKKHSLLSLRTFRIALEAAWPSRRSVVRPLPRATSGETAGVGAAGLGEGGRATGRVWLGSSAGALFGNSGARRNVSWRVGSAGASVGAGTLEAWPQWPRAAGTAADVRGPTVSAALGPTPCSATPFVICGRWGCEKDATDPGPESRFLIPGAELFRGRLTEQGKNYVHLATVSRQVVNWQPAG